MTYQVTRTDEQWRSELSEDEYAVLREAATERPWTGELLDEEEGRHLPVPGLWPGAVPG